MGDCPFQVTYDMITPALWSKPVPTEEEDLDEEIDTWTTTWTAKMIYDYHTGMTADNELFDEFQQDFEGWSLDFFQAVDKQTLRSLKAVLRQRGVYTGRTNLNVPNALFNLLQSEEPLQWHEGELQATDLHPRSIHVPSWILSQIPWWVQKKAQTINFEQTHIPWDLDSHSLGFPSLLGNSSTAKLFYHYHFIINLLSEHCFEHCVLC
jgi:hypothetical protein